MGRNQKSQLFNADCFSILPTLSDRSVQCVITDMPYGTTDCHWDKAPDLDAWWIQLERIATEGAVFVLFAAQPFTTALINSRPKWFRYDLTWDKVRAVGHLNANRQPMRVHEQVLIFCRRPALSTYNPQFTPGTPYRTKKAGGKLSQVYRASNAYSSVNPGRRHPTSILRFEKPSQRDRLHPTEKPTSLLAWLVRSYSKPGQTVLDTFMGSGSTIAAAIAAGRHAIGIERDPEIFAAASRRIERVRE
jgi:site-specific DNA-methyltransferase (adenine-specific)